MDYEKILVSYPSINIARITLNTPHTLNALDLEMRSELNRAVDEIINNSSIKILILNGEGSAFSSGGNIQSMTGTHLAVNAKDRLISMHQFLTKIRNWGGLVIASIHGYVFGAGFNLVLACDHVIAASDTKLCQSFAKLGLIPDCGGLWLLPRLIGPLKAKELLLRSSVITAEEGFQIGLINDVVPKEELNNKTLEIAKKYAEGPRLAYEYIKRMINESYSYSFEELLEKERLVQGICMETDDFKEGVNAFLNKRKPIFKS